MIINDLDGYYIVFDTKNWNTELDTLVLNLTFLVFDINKYTISPTSKLAVFTQLINPLFIKLFA